MNPDPHPVRAGASLGLLALVVFLSGCGGAGGGGDVILVTVDTLRADRVGAYGYAGAETPAMDGLAERGVVFTRAMTPMPRTTPGLASLLTGLLPHRHGSREVGRPVDGTVTLLSELLAERGYHAVAVSANGAAGPVQGLDRGFERFVAMEELSSQLAGTVTDRALELVTEAPEGVPLLLWVHYIDPHAPYEPPAPWGERPAGKGCRELARRAETQGWEGGHLFSDREGASSAALESCSAMYDAEVAYTDHELGRLLEGVEAARGLGGTLVVLTADHGENLGEQGLYYQHGPSLHEASLRVPLILAGPGVPEGETEEALVGLEDVMPMVLGRLGLEVPEGLDGEDAWGHRGLGALWGAPEELVYAEAGSALMEHNSLYVYSGRAGGFHCFNGPRFSLCGSRQEGLGLYDRERDPDLEVDVSERFPDARARLMGAVMRWAPEEVRERAVRDPRFKLVERPRLEGGYRRVLVDLEADPAETTNVAGEHPDVVRRLGPLLDAFGEKLPIHAPPERSSEELEALEALGYLR